MKKITRPWQATFLAIIGGLEIVISSSIFLLLLIIKDELSVWLSQFNPSLIVISAIKPTIFIPLIGFIIFLLFIVRGLWKGEKWAPVCLAIIQGLSLLLMGFWGISNLKWTIPFAFVLFILALDIECWIHPFFNKQKK